MIRSVNESEVKIASDLADRVYQEKLYESYECFLQKFLYFPRGFLGKFDANELVGYVIGHPWEGEKPVPLNSNISQLIKTPDCFYIHDVVIDPKQCGRGYSRGLFSKILDIGEEEGYNRFMCVTVSIDGERLVKRFNFKKIEEIRYTDNVTGLLMVKNI